MKHTLKFAILLCVILAGCNAHHENGNDGDSREAPVTLDNPFVHTAYFWFNEEATQEQKDAFINDTEKLRDISTVKGLFYGAPANTDRPVVEKSYDFAVIVHFENLAGHDTYQADQIHLDLLTNHSSIWERVMVTDVDPH